MRWTRPLRWVGSVGVIVIAVGASMVSPVLGYQGCLPNSSCIVGEFVYNDNYVPVTNATCTLSAKDPAGQDFLVSQALSPQSDGWYAHTFSTTGLDLGLYRASLCCVVEGETMCLDKSFEIANSISDQQVAQAVWNAPTGDFTATGSFGANLQNPVPLVADIWSYGSRTLTGYGTLIADIWGYSSRSLSQFGTLISDIWSNPTRSLSTATLDSGQLATSDTVSTAVSDIKGTDNKDLSQLSDDVAYIRTSVDSINTKIDALDTKVTTLSTTTTDIINKWGSYSIVDLITYLDTIDSNLGTNADTCVGNDTIFGNIQCVRDKWGAQSASDIYLAANSAAATAVLIRTELGFSGKSSTAFDEFTALKAYVDTLETSLGSAADSQAQPTIFGRLALVQEMVDDLMITEQDIDVILERWGEYTVEDIFAKIETVSGKVSSVNTVAGVDEILSLTKANQASTESLINAVLALQALTETNRVLLEQATNQPVIKVWLENGSVVFKILVTNPSSLASQTVPLKYYLPKEVSQEDIISLPSELEVAYDPVEGRLYVYGEFSLSPKATKIFSVEVTDIWVITDQEINSILSQADTLFAPLKDTELFAGGSLLYNDIKAHIDRALSYQSQALTPEARIKAFREAQIELDAAKAKLDDLKTLVSGSSKAPAPGFSSQLMITSGAIVLGVLMVLAIVGQVLTHVVARRRATPRRAQVTKPKPTAAPKTIKLIQLSSNTQNKRPVAKLSLALGAVVMTVGIGVVLISNRPQPEIIPTLAQDEPETIPQPTPTPLPTGPQVEILETGLGYLNVRSEPKVGSELVARAQVGVVYDEQDRLVNEAGDEWVQISLDAETTGWVLARYVSGTTNHTLDPTEQSLPTPTPTPLSTPDLTTEPAQILGQTTARIVIKVPEGFANVKVRVAPDLDSLVLYRYWMEHHTTMVDEQPGWIKVTFPATEIEGETYDQGWVVADYVTKL